MVLKRKTCPDCGRSQGSRMQWLNNQKLCAVIQTSSKRGNFLKAPIP
jgi:hypothetical protein